MSSSSKLDRPLSTSGNLGSYNAASFDRSNSFCKNTDDMLLSNLPNMSRSNSSVTQGDVQSFFQCLRFDPKSMVVDHKLDRTEEFERLASAVVGVSGEDSQTTLLKSKQKFSPLAEDLRRLRSGARESGTKARERVKVFNDCLSVINKFFPSVPSRKRSRLDTLSVKSKTLLFTDGSTTLSCITKTGSQDLDCTTEIKKTIPSKRTRTSMVDVQESTPAKPSKCVNKVKDVMRIPIERAVHREEWNVPINIDGWEKSKMKKRRTGIKHDAASRSMTTKVVDGSRESVKGMQPHFSTETQPRLTDAYSVRSGLADGVSGVGKAEVTSSGNHSSVSRTDSENSSLLHTRREQYLSGQVKARANVKAVNRENSQEDFCSESPNSGSKMYTNANIHAPRSSSGGGGVSKFSKEQQQSLSSNGWELSSCMRILPKDHKNKPARSSSPPVTNRVERPQKISKTARRSNLTPFIHGNDDIPVADSTSDMEESESDLPVQSPRKVKLINGNCSPATLSENGGLSASEMQSRHKNKIRAQANVQTMSTLLLPPRKNKGLYSDGLGDGVRRKGRTIRASTSSRNLSSTVGKVGNVGTTKRIKSSSKLGVDKTERLGRPPTRKLCDRKGYARKKHITFDVPPDFLVGSDDCREKLLAAAKAVSSIAEFLSSPFWKMMETMFHFISDADISYLKDQVHMDSSMGTLNSDPASGDAESFTLVTDGYGLNEFEKDENDSNCIELRPELAPSAGLSCEIPLYQRLIAAMIPEEGNEEILDCGTSVPTRETYGSRYEMEKGLKSGNISEASRGVEISGYLTSNNCCVNAKGGSFHEPDHTVNEDNVIRFMPNGEFQSYGHLQNGLHVDTMMPDTVSSECQYHSMSVNERLLMEVHSIGIYPDLVSGEEEKINDVMSTLHGKCREQVSRKKDLVSKLIIFASEAKEIQEKEFEGRALDKLVGMGYEKYMSCWGRSAHGTKGASGKVPKKAALSFVKWALERCHEFEVTGKSCFDEPLFRDTFLYEVSHLTDVIRLACNNDDETRKHHLDPSGWGPTEGTTGSQKTPSSNGEEDCYPSNSAKGKRSERDREEKGREMLSKTGTSKLGRTGTHSVTGESKSKAMLKQSIAHLSASVNGPLGKFSDQSRVSLPSSVISNEVRTVEKDKNSCNVDVFEEPIDLSGLQIPEMDDFGVNDLVGNGDDLGSFLNFDVDGLQDLDYIGGLEIPQDDLSELNLMV